MLGQFLNFCMNLAHRTPGLCPFQGKVTAVKAVSQQLLQSVHTTQVPGAFGTLSAVKAIVKSSHGVQPSNRQSRCRCPTCLMHTRRCQSKQVSGGMHVKGLHTTLEFSSCPAMSALQFASCPLTAHVCSPYPVMRHTLTSQA